MNLNGFDNQQPELAKNGRGGRFNPWTAQHKAKLKANAKKRVKKVAVTKPMPTQAMATSALVATQAVPVLALPPAAKESSLDKFVGVFQQAAPVVIASVTAAKNQKRIDKLQQQRLAAGQPMLTVEEIDAYNDAIAPTVKVKGGIDNNTNKYLLMGGLGIAGLFLVMRNKPRVKNA